ncbi:hypothetical protein ACFX13_019693 [Malus domestica]
MRTVDHTIRLGLKDAALMGAGADGCGCRWVRCGQVCRASGKREVVIVVQVLGNHEVAGTVVDAIVSDQVWVQFQTSISSTRCNGFSSEFLVQFFFS